MKKTKTMIMLGSLKNRPSKSPRIKLIMKSRPSCRAESSSKIIMKRT